MISPHVLIDGELDMLEQTATPVTWSVMILRMLIQMMTDGRITLEEFNHYCKRLNEITARRKEAV